jgi:hypothetical protein
MQAILMNFEKAIAIIFDSFAITFTAIIIIHDFPQGTCTGYLSHPGYFSPIIRTFNPQTIHES